MRTNTENIDNFETLRLFARRLKEDDFDLIVPMYKNPLIMSTLGGVLSEDIIREKFQWNLERWNQDGFGQWLWIEKTSNNFIGRGGLRKVEIEGQQVTEIGYVLLPEYWDKGYATEITVASVNIAFELLNIPELACFTLVTNLKSQRVMEKAGFQFVHNFIYHGQKHVLYQLKKNSNQ